ncbi:hypothetical protein GCM10007079_30860 [Nocardiopsis terrae]|nr:hypothetical protein GCM10007079_30860 [Nocardiopsis terrae]
MMRRLDAGFAVIGDVQFLPGCSVLLVDTPRVEKLTELPRCRRRMLLSDMERLGEAVERTCRRLDPDFRRVSLEIGSAWRSWATPTHSCTRTYGRGSSGSQPRL